MAERDYLSPDSAPHWGVQLHKRPLGTAGRNYHLLPLLKATRDVSTRTSWEDISSLNRSQAGWKEALLGIAEHLFGFKWLQCSLCKLCCLICGEGQEMTLGLDSGKLNSNSECNAVGIAAHHTFTGSHDCQIFKKKRHLLSIFTSHLHFWLRTCFSHIKNV